MSDNMNVEQEIKINQNQGEVASSEPPEAIQPESLIDHSLFVGLPDIPRRGEIRKQREEKANQTFRDDVEILTRLSLIDINLKNSQITEREGLKFPNKNDLLKAYDEAPESKKKRYRSGVRSNNEMAEKLLLGRIKDDLVKLLRDQGYSDDEIKQRVEDIATMQVGKNRRELFQLDKKGQILLIEGAMELRERLLIGGFEEYMYLLSYSDPIPLDSATQKTQEERKDKFRNASSSSEKAAISAQTRDLAKKGLRKTFDVNLVRLAKLETLYGRSEEESEMENFRASFDKAGLGGKSTIISRIQERKLNLGKHLLPNIRKLRRTLETDLEISRAIIGVNPDEGKSIEDETNLALSYLATMKEMTGRKDTMNELDEDDLREIVDDMVLVYENPNLKEALEAILLLRLASNEFFDL